MIIKDNSRGVLAIDWSLANYSPCTRPYLHSEFVAKVVLDSDVPETFVSFTYIFVISKVQSLTSGKDSFDKKCKGTETLFNFINEIIKHDFNPTIFVLLADELHALSLQAELTMPLDELRSMCQHKSKEYSKNFPNPWLTRQYHLSFWGDWKRGEYRQRFEEILETLRTKISEQRVFEDELERTVRTLFDKYLIQYKTAITERAALAQIPISEQKKIEKKRVTPFFVDFAIEQMAVIQLIAEKMGQCNFFFPGAPNQSLYTLRDFWSVLSNYPSKINGPPLQIFGTFTKAIERGLGGPVRLRRFVNEIGVKLIITDNTIYLSIPVEPPQQPKLLSPDNVAPSSQCLPTTEPARAAINHRPWSLYFNILADLLCQTKTTEAIKKLILIIIEMHYRTYRIFKNAALPHYTVPMPLFTSYKVQVEPDVNPHNHCSSTYVFVFSVVDALLTDRGYHSVECIKATVNFINDLVASDNQAKVIILLADELQALNAQAESNLTLEELRQVYHNKGAAWFSRTKLYFDKILGGYKLYHWGEWIRGLHQQRFQEIVQSYQDKLREYPDFERAALQTYTPYLEKCLKSTRRERGIITPFFAAYPLEETAVIQSIIETLGSINLFYPKMLNPTLYYLRDFWSLLTGSNLKKSWLPFISFQIPCVPRKTITGIPQIAPTIREREDFPFSFNRHRLFQALPLNWRIQSHSRGSTPERADSTHKVQSTEQLNTSSHSAIWLFCLGSIVKYIYDQSVTDEEKQEMVISLQNCYHPSDDEN